MEITIKRYRRKLTYVDAATLDEFWELAKRAERSLDRTRLSQLNGWTDEAGRVYIIFPIEKIAERIGKSMTTAKNVLAELEAAGLIERKRQQFSKPNHIYVKLPDG